MLNLQRLSILTLRLREADSTIRLLLPHLLHFSRGTRRVCQPPSMKKTMTMTMTRTTYNTREADSAHHLGLRKYIFQPPSMKKTTKMTMTKMRTTHHTREAALLHSRREVRRHVLQQLLMKKTRTMTKMRTIRYTGEAALLHSRRGVRRHVCQLLPLEAESILPPPRQFLIFCLSPVRNLAGSMQCYRFCDPLYCHAQPKDTQALVSTGARISYPEAQS